MKPLPPKSTLTFLWRLSPHCRAHLKLYDALKQLGQVLYFDADSVIYHWKPTAPELTLGKYLGQFTN